jgi:TonB family protein
LAETAFDSGRADAAFLMAVAFAVEGDGRQADAEQWLNLGAANKDWRSRYAQGLREKGMLLRDAMNSALEAQYSDYADAFVGKNNMASQMTPPKSISVTSPVFPTGLAGLNTKGAVTVEFTVGADGIPYGIQPVNASHAELASAVVAAVEQWRFVPGQKDGHPVPTKMRIPVRFRGEGG